MVVITIIGLLSTIVYASFDEGRRQTRDKTRTSSLKELQLAVELYKAQNGVYPAAGCGATAAQFAGPGPATLTGLVGNCSSYVGGLLPDYTPSLPLDPNQEYDDDKGFYYRSNGDSYKIMVRESIETRTVNDFTDDFARCLSAAGACASGVPANTYAVYSPGAEDW